MTEQESSSKQQQPKEVTAPRRSPRLQEPEDNHPKRRSIPKEAQAPRRSPRLQEPKDNQPQSICIPKEAQAPRRSPRLQEPKDVQPQSICIPKEAPATQRPPRLQEPKDNKPQSICSPKEVPTTRRPPRLQEPKDNKPRSICSPKEVPNTQRPPRLQEPKDNKPQSICSPQEVPPTQGSPRLQESKDDHPQRIGISEEASARRRSARLQEPKDSYSQRKRIPKGTDFQVDVPDWIGMPEIADVPPSRNSPDDSRWLGTQLWPPEDDTSEIGVVMIGKGRPDSCSCSSPGDKECIKRHLEKETERLKSDLGPVFFEWKFNEMGEEVAKSWNPVEEDLFADIEKLNPNYEGKNFIETAMDYFQYRSSQNILSYYFNVYLPRRIRRENEVTPGTANSND